VTAPALEPRLPRRQQRKSVRMLSFASSTRWWRRPAHPGPSVLRDVISAVKPEFMVSVLFDPSVRVRG
jgi:hypothetical protein